LKKMEEYQTIGLGGGLGVGKSLEAKDREIIDIPDNGEVYKEVSDFSIDEIKVETELEHWVEEDSGSGDDNIADKDYKAASTVTKNKVRELPRKNKPEIGSVRRNWFTPRESSLLALGNDCPTVKQIVERFLYFRKEEHPPKKATSLVSQELIHLWKEYHSNEFISKPMVKKKIENLVIMYKNYVKPSNKMGQFQLQKLFCEKFDLSNLALEVKKEEEVVTTKAALNNFSWMCEPKLELEDSEAIHNGKSTKKNTHKTIDFYDYEIGDLIDPDRPTAVEFASSILREAIFNPHVEKIRLGSLLLHLFSKTHDFENLYKYYLEVEKDVFAGATSWEDKEYFTNVAENIINAVKSGQTEYDANVLSKAVSQHSDGLVPDLEENQDQGCSPPDLEETQDQDTEQVYPDTSLEEDETYKPKRKIKPKVTDSKAKPKGKRGRPRKLPIEKTDVDLDTDEEEARRKKAKKYEHACNQCDSVFRAVRKLDIHLFEEHSFGSLCSQCGHQSDTYNEYEAHMESHYIQCEVCQVTVHGLKGLRSHNSRHHKIEKEESEQEKEDTMCYVCGKKLRKSYLHLHIRNVHDVETVQCDKCEFTTNSKDKLRIHMRRTHLNTLKTCPVCKKQVRMLKRHWEVTKCGGKVTTGVFTCDICNKQMSTAMGLKKHKKVIHMKAKDKQCELCSYATYSTFNLRLHVTKVHTKQTMETNCRVCSIKTYSIDWHMKTYHDEVPWQPGLSA